uniref:Uncharacterized protein n=1 Tax=Oryza brachyantha TaxID=4533 RepID=J3MFD9_ORYBR
MYAIFSSFEEDKNTIRMTCAVRTIAKGKREIASISYYMVETMTCACARDAGDWQGSSANGPPVAKAVALPSAWAAAARPSGTIRGEVVLQAASGRARQLGLPRLVEYCLVSNHNVLTATHTGHEGNPKQMLLPRLY